MSSWSYSLFLHNINLCIWCIWLLTSLLDISQKPFILNYQNCVCKTTMILVTWKWNFSTWFSWQWYPYFTIMVKNHNHNCHYCPFKSYPKTLLAYCHVLFRPNSKDYIAAIFKCNKFLHNYIIVIKMLYLMHYFQSDINFVSTLSLSFVLSLIVVLIELLNIWSKNM